MKNLPLNIFYESTAMEFNSPSQNIPNTARFSSIINENLFSCLDTGWGIWLEVMLYEK